MGQITATRNLVATKVVRLAGQSGGTHLSQGGPDKMAAILQTMFSKAFSSEKIVSFNSNFTEVYSQGFK